VTDAQPVARSPKALICGHRAVTIVPQCSFRAQR
jgi:hypothetical protein